MSKKPGSALDNAELEIASDKGDRGWAPSLSSTSQSGFDPYARVGTAGRVDAGQTVRPGRRDLKKLGEWIKLQRQMAERANQPDEE
ncbi:MAG: hypothetical protein R3E77_02955 [Steroidobacteraceae bacterium]